MPKIALTGSPGSGKTTVSEMFKALGAEVINADKICHNFFIPCQKSYHEIVNYFGKECLNPDKTLNTSYLRQRLISSKKDKQILETILHPRIYAKIMEILNQLKEKLVIIEIPLLFEVGWESDFDKVIVVYASKEKCLSRLQKKGLSLQEAEKILALQWPIEKKINKAHFVIDNNGDLNTTEKQVKEIWRKLITDYLKVAFYLK